MEEQATGDQNYRFNYVFIGDQNKPIVLFLHGFMGCWQDFQEIADLLQPAFCCLLVDLPGHGKTEVSSDRYYQMPEVAMAIVNLLKQLSIPRCFLIGYSMGGRLALYLAVFFSEYFIKVVLESASPGLETESARKNRIRQDAKLSERLLEGDLADFFQQWYQNPLFSLFVECPNFDLAIARKLNNNPHKLAKSLTYMGLGQQPSLWNHLKFIQPPTLLLVGEFDHKFIAINQKVSLFSSKFKMKIVKNTDHNVHFERSREFVSYLRCFF